MKTGYNITITLFFCQPNNAIHPPTPTNHDRVCVFVWNISIGGFSHSMYRCVCVCDTIFRIHPYYNEWHVITTTTAMTMMIVNNQGIVTLFFFFSDSERRNTNIVDQFFFISMIGWLVIFFQWLIWLYNYRVSNVFFSIDNHSISIG